MGVGEIDLPTVVREVSLVPNPGVGEWKGKKESLESECAAHSFTLLGLMSLVLRIVI